MGHRLKFVLFSALLAAVLLPQPARAAREKGFSVVAVIIKDESAGMMSEPAALFFDEAKKRMYVADTLNNRLVSFDFEFRYLSELSHENFAMPMGVVKTSSGEFFIVDGKTNEMKLVDVQNKVIKPFEIKGLPPAIEKFIPGRFSMDNDERIYVIDRLNRRIIVVDRDGNFIRAVSPPKAQRGGRVFYGFNDLRVDAFGGVYAVDTVGRAVYVFDPSGALVSSFGAWADEGVLFFPVSIAVNGKGDIYVLDSHRGRIEVFNRSGALEFTISKKGVGVGEVYSPSYLFIDAAGRLYVIDGARVQVFEEGK